jgi:hypothetical protein
MRFGKIRLAREDGSREFYDRAAEMKRVGLPKRASFVAVLAAALLALAIVSVPGAGAASRVHVLASAHGGIDGVACWAERDCLAVGSNGPFRPGVFHVSVRGGVPGARHPLRGVEIANPVTLACPTAAECLVPASKPGGRCRSEAVVVRIVDGSQQGASTLPATCRSPTAIGCVSDTTCFATAISLSGARLFRLTDGRSDGGHSFPFGAVAMSCARSQGCVAVQAGTSEAVALTISPSGVVGPTVPLSNQDLPIQAVSCPSLATCWALGGTTVSNFATDLVRLNPQTGAEIATPQPRQMEYLEAISCWSPTACIVGGSNATKWEPQEGFPTLISATAGVFGSPRVLLSGPPKTRLTSGGIFVNGGSVNGLSCFSASTCTVVGWLYRGGVGAGFTAWN